MAAYSRRIQALQFRIDTLKANPNSNVNCSQLARMEIELAQLYNAEGERSKASELIDDAYRRLEDPECIRNRMTDSMLNYLKQYKENPRMADVKPMPSYYRYISLIILLVGYAGIYAFSQFVKISSNDYFIGIIIVFIFSMIINSVLNSNYKKYVQRTVSGGSAMTQDASVASSSQSSSVSTQSNPRLLSNADKDLMSAGNMLRKKDYTGAQGKVMEAINTLNDPTCPQGDARDMLLQKAHEMEKQIQDAQSGFGMS